MKLSSLGTIATSRQTAGVDQPTPRAEANRRGSQLLQPEVLNSSGCAANAADDGADEPDRPLRAVTGVASST
jgi:hypothetical protein